VIKETIIKKLKNFKKP